VKVNNLIPNNSLNNNNLSFLNKLNGKSNSKSILFSNKNLSDTTSNIKSKQSLNSKNNLIMTNNLALDNTKNADSLQRKTICKDSSKEKSQEIPSKSNPSSEFYFKKIDPLIDKTKAKYNPFKDGFNRGASNMNTDKKTSKNKPNCKIINISNSKTCESKKVSYIEKKEINLHNKTKNSSIFNLSNNVDQTTMTKSVTHTNLSKQQSTSKNENNSSMKFELKNFDKINKYNDSEMFKFITSSIDRIERIEKLKESNSKGVSPTNITCGTNKKTNDQNSPKTLKKEKNDKCDQSNTGKKHKSLIEQISFDAKENGMNDIFTNLGNLNDQNKSRNQQRNTFVKNNFFCSDRNQSFQSNTLNKNTMKEKSNKQGILPKSTFEMENKTVHKVPGNAKYNTNFRLNLEKTLKKKENGGINYNSNVGNSNNFFTKIDNTTKINFRINNKYNGKFHVYIDKYYLINTNNNSKIELKKQNTLNKKTQNKSVSKDKITNSNSTKDYQNKAFKTIHETSTTNNKNNSYFLKKSDILIKYKANLIKDKKITEKQRKLSYDLKAQNI